MVASLRSRKNRPTGGRKLNQAIDTLERFVQSARQPSIDTYLNHGRVMGTAPVGTDNTQRHVPLINPNVRLVSSFC